MDNRYPVLLPGGLAAFKMLTTRLGKAQPLILSLERDREQLQADLPEHIDKGTWIGLVDCEQINSENTKML